MGVINKSASAVSTVATKARTWVNVAEVWGIAMGAGIVWKYAWVGEPVAEILADGADYIPELITIGGPLSSVNEGIMNAASYIGRLPDLPNDMSNLANIWIWLWALSAVKLVLTALWGKKWRIEATGHTLVWTALTAYFTKELAELAISWDTLRVLSYFTEDFYADVFPYVPDNLRSAFMDPTIRKTLYGSVVWALWLWAFSMAKRNAKRAVYGIPKKETE